MTVEKLFANIEGLIDSGTLVYIATNEKDLSYFQPMAERFNLRFLRYFSPELGKVSRVELRLCGIIMVQDRRNDAIPCLCFVWYSDYAEASGIEHVDPAIIGNIEQVPVSSAESLRYRICRACLKARECASQHVA
jgi:hypothetical protein